ncbi:MAG: EamA family transporter [Pseudomonadota bacterium]
MASSRDIILTAVAPAVWGSTYLITTELLPPDHPVLMATLRALPAGLLLLLIVRKLPPVAWIGRVAILGALNFSIFWALLFVAAYRLPGGVAATVGAVQPLLVILLASLLLGRAVTGLSVGAAVLGALGVALLVLGPDAALNPMGIAAGLGGAVSMAAGTVLSRRWQPPVPPLTFAAWQLTAGGLLLLPVALAAEPALPPLSAENLIGVGYLALVGGALTYLLWFRGVARLEPAAVSTLGFLSPLSAIVLGWSVLGESLDAVQIAGAVIVLASVALGQLGGGGAVSVAGILRVLALRTLPSRRMGRNSSSAKDRANVEPA